MPEQQTMFWMVWNPESGRTNFRHPTPDLAEAEARRLAERNPHSKFYVLQAVSVAMRAPLPVAIISLRTPTCTEMDDANEAAKCDAEMPF